MAEPRQGGVPPAADEEFFHVDELARACARDGSWVRLRIAEGLLRAESGGEGEWQFTAATLRRARRMAGIERDFDAVPELAALVADLLDEMDRLRRRLRCAGLE